jgi:hypothetical protein
VIPLIKLTKMECFRENGSVYILMVVLNAEAYIKMAIRWATGSVNSQMETGDIK